MVGRAPLGCEQHAFAAAGDTSQVCERCARIDRQCHGHCTCAGVQDASPIFRRSPVPPQRREAGTVQWLTCLTSRSDSTAACEHGCAAENVCLLEVIIYGLGRERQTKREEAFNGPGTALYVVDCELIASST